MFPSLLISCYESNRSTGRPNYLHDHATMTPFQEEEKKEALIVDNVSQS